MTSKEDTWKALREPTIHTCHNCENDSLNHKDKKDEAQVCDFGTTCSSTRLVHERVSRHEGPDSWKWDGINDQ